MSDEIENFSGPSKASGLTRLSYLVLFLIAAPNVTSAVFLYGSPDNARRLPHRMSAAAIAAGTKQGDTPDVMLIGTLGFLLKDCCGGNQNNLNGRLH